MACAVASAGGGLLAASLCTNTTGAADSASAIREHRARRAAIGERHVTSHRSRWQAGSQSAKPLASASSLSAKAAAAGARSGAAHLRQVARIGGLFKRTAKARRLGGVGEHQLLGFRPLSPPGGPKPWPFTCALGDVDQALVSVGGVHQAERGPQLVAPQAAMVETVGFIMMSVLGIEKKWGTHSLYA